MTFEVENQIKLAKEQVDIFYSSATTAKLQYDAIIKSDASQEIKKQAELLKTKSDTDLAEANKWLKHIRDDLEPKLEAQRTLANVQEIPIPGGGTAKILTAQSDGLFTAAEKNEVAAAIPASASAALANAQQKAAELASAIGGQSNKSAVMPENGATRLKKPNYTTEDFKMKLRSKQTGFTIIFNVTPTIDESRSANYEHISPVHHPGTIQIYKNTEARQFNITVKLIARTAAEASLNVKYINAIRSWVMPYYGQGTANSSESNRLGAPPDILVFDVYGDKNIAALPVVLTSYHWVYPDMVDYIPTEEGIPFPTIMDISLSLVESYSPEEYTSFDITEYRAGNMATAYSFASLPANTIPDIDQQSSDEAERRAIIESFTNGDGYI